MMPAEDRVGGAERGNNSEMDAGWAFGVSRADRGEESPA